jgi:glycosyltransferase involved in cell wall biosynthesis
MEPQEFPSVSVVVPARNAADTIGGCLEALSGQSYPQDRYEVIVIDNGSTDETREVVRHHPVRLLEETSYRSPYPARNLGVEHARGQLLAFTDADCRPDASWLEAGVDSRRAHNAHLVGGRVVFTFRSGPSVGEMVDALWHLDVERQIIDNHAAMTANLLVDRSVFDAIGGFDLEARSGGDGRWTRRATDAGFELVYAPAAVVRKPARPMWPLLGKAYRVGRGLPAAWSERGLGRGGVGGAIVRNLLPPQPRVVRERIRQRRIEGAERRVLIIWWASWLLEMMRSAGAFHGWLELASRSMVESSGGGDVGG